MSGSKEIVKMHPTRPIIAPPRVNKKILLSIFNSLSAFNLELDSSVKHRLTYLRFLSVKINPSTFSKLIIEN